MFVHAEQGYGDTIQFLRYIPRLASQGAKVPVDVQPSLLPLAQRIAGVTQVFASGEVPSGLDFWSPNRGPGSCNQR